MRTVFIAAATAIALGTCSGALAQVQFSEIRTGSNDNEYIEIVGTPGASLNGVTFLILGDGTGSGATPTRTGVVEWKWTFGKNDVIGANGYAVLRNPLMTTFTVAPGATDLSWLPGETPETETGFEGNDNQTYLLVTGYSGTDTFEGRAPNGGAGGQDLDTNDDGVLDVTPWTSIIDSVSLIETNGSAPAAGQDWWYSSVVAGPYISRYIATSTTGTVVAGWDFQTTTNPNGGTAAAAQPNTPKVFNSNAGFGTLYLDGSNGASDWAQASELNSFSGTATNANANNGFSTVTSGQASLALVNQTANAKSVVFKFSMSGIKGLNVSYATQRTSTGFNSQQWAWSTDGSEWTDIDLIDTIPSSFSLRSLNALSSLDGAPEAYLRLTVNGASTAAGNNRLDNVQLLSDPVSEEQIVVTYGAPVHVFLNGEGGWDIGVLATEAALDTPGAANAVIPSYTCGDPNAGACEAAHSTPFCNNSCCCEYVCGVDPWCCEIRWDSICETQSLNCATECAGGGCVADLDFDATVGGADLGILLSSWGTGDADLDNDGNTGGSDLGQLLAAWGACP